MKAARENTERSDWSLANEGGALIGRCFLSNKDAVGCCHGAERFQLGVIFVCVSANGDETDSNMCVCVCVVKVQIVVSTVGFNAVRAECESCLAAAASV